MIDTHWIEFIEVLTEDGVYRKNLSLGGTSTEFNINIDEVIEVRGFCNTCCGVIKIKR